MSEPAPAQQTSTNHWAAIDSPSWPTSSSAATAPASGSARAIIAKKPAAAIKESWIEWLHCEILCREAEQLLAK